MTVMTSDEFWRDASETRRALAGGPIFVTEGGETTEVHLTIEEYRRLTRQGTSLADFFSGSDSGDVDLEVPPRSRELARAAEFD